MDDAELEALLRRVVTGDKNAWRELWTAVTPALKAVSGSWQVAGALSRREDDRRNIEVLVMERLAAEDFRRIRRYLESRDASEGGSFRAWLATVVRLGTVLTIETVSWWSDLVYD